MWEPVAPRDGSWSSGMQSPCMRSPCRKEGIFFEAIKDG